MSLTYHVVAGTYINESDTYLNLCSSRSLITPTNSVTELKLTLTDLSFARRSWSCSASAYTCPCLPSTLTPTTFTTYYFGTGRTIASTTPPTIIVGVVPPTLTLSHYCVILDNGALMCFGGNGNGQLGYGDNTTRSLPTTSSAGDAYPTVNLGTGRTAKRVFRAASTITGTCALLDNNDYKCWWV